MIFKMKKHDEKKEETSSNKKFAVQLTPKGTLGWFFLCFFISGWMFLLGIFVGRGTMPVKFDIKKLEKELSALKDNVIKQEQSKMEMDSNAISNKVGLDFYEALKNTEDDAGLKSDKPPVESSGVRKPLPVKVSSLKKKEYRLKKTRTAKVSQNKDMGTTVKKAESNSQYTIQISSLKDPKAADRMVKKFKKMGYPAYKTKTNIDGKGVWFRVRIGTFQNHAEARRTLGRLKKQKIDGILLNVG